MNFNNAVQLLYSIFNRGIDLWCENNKIKVFIPDNEALSSEEKDNLRINREQIFALLLLNKITSRTMRKKILVSNVDIAPLSFAQERLWFINKLEGGTSAYNKPIIFELSESISLSKLEKSLEQLILRHEILRTLIKMDENGFGYQCIMDLAKYPFKTRYCVVENIDEFKVCLEDELSYVYKLDEEYPIRAAFYEEELQKKRYLVIVVHHVAFDGWSTGIFLRDLEKFYQDFAVPELDIQYKDFALWQRAYLSGTRLVEQLTYWKNCFKDYIPLNLLTDKVRPNKIDYSGAEIYFKLDLETSNGLRELAKKCKVSLYTVLLSGYYLLLRVLSYQNDIVLGTPIANRHYSQIEDLIGFFVNSLALRMKIDSSLDVKNFIKDVGRMFMAAQMHQDLPFEKLVEELQIVRDSSRHPLFQVMFGVESIGTKECTTSKNTKGIKLYSGMVEHKVAIFDLSTFVTDDLVGPLKAVFHYATSLYERETIERFILVYEEILKQFAGIEVNGDKKISELRYVNEDDYAKIVYKWNQTKNAYPSDKTLQELFEKQVEKTPDAIAVVHGEKKLNYRELNEQANQLAHYIRERYHIEAEDLIGLYLDRSELVVIGILGILKTGCAYVPMDPLYPEERVSYILEDTQAKMVLTNGVYKEKLQKIVATNKKVNTGIVAIDEARFKEVIISYPKTNSTIMIGSNFLAYVIYTSGTTGKAKGVMIEHKGVINLLSMQIEEFSLSNITIQRHCLSYATYVFDAHVWDIYAPLISGNVLHILDDIVRQDFNLLQNYVANNHISIATIPPIILNHNNLLELDTLIVAGDKADVKVLDAYYLNHVDVVNAYGPTEITVCASLNHYTNNGVANIGKPINNTMCYVLNENLTPLPVGVVGELYIGGVGLARGYLNQPKLTREKFIANPFHDGYMYKTGDLVRYLADGNLEYIGRNDYQVKIRGYRVELGEIEAQLCQYREIKQSVALVKESVDEAGKPNGNHYLIGYYIASDPLDEAKILAFLRQSLPEYMVPEILVYLKTLPLTINGKLDVKNLPLPELNNSQNYVEPCDELENKLVEIWSDVLGLAVEKIGVHDNFFKLGGNSIKIIQLQSKLIQQLKIAIAVADLFKYPTINTIVKSIYSINKEPEHYHLMNLTGTNENDIAIIGMSGAFSGCDDIDSLWDIVIGKKSGLDELSLDECRLLGVTAKKLNNKKYIPISGRVKNIDQFDPSFWGVSPLEAKLMDPQIRKFLEHAWIALEQSGYIKDRENLSIGVFAGSGHTEYLYNYILKSDIASTLNMWQVLQLNGKDALATRVSYALGLTGPSLSINTTCSTSLVAIVEACEKLSSGKCDMALAGGVSFGMPNSHGYIFEEGMIASSDGHCRPFDIKANGIVEGAGIGVVLLKRLSDAKRDGDKIFAVIKGYAMNNDGSRKTSFSAPSIIGQAECIYNAQKMANIESHAIDYVECHGTGTRLGDPIEIAALHDAFSANAGQNQSRVHKCIIGAIKANIGHADSAAGIAGLFKVCKMLEHKVIPPQMNYSQINPELKMESHFEVITESRQWERNNHVRTAGVSSFGIGGTNAHVIVSEYEDDAPTDSIIENKRYVLPFSAKTRQSLQLYQVVLTQFLKNNSAVCLSNIAYTLQNKRENFCYRSYVVGRDISECITNLENKHITIRDKRDINSAISIFAFPGQGSQYANMGLDLYQTESLFKKIVDDCINIANSMLDVDFNKILFPKLYHIEANNEEKLINQTEWAQLAIFIISYSCAKFLAELGIKSKTYIGHSIGEYVAATLAGVFELKDALRVVIERGRLMQKMPKGAMLSIKASLDEIQRFLNQGIEVAAINAPGYVVVSGDKLQIAELYSKLSENNILGVLLKTSHAYHSKMMDEAQHQFKSFLLKINLYPPQIPFISSLSGDFITNKEATSAEYWSNQLRHMVKFSDGIQAATQKFKDAIFIEVGFGATLSTFITQHKNKEGKALSSVSILTSFNEYKGGKVNSSEDIIGNLWAHGIDINFNKYYKYRNPHNIILPPYQFLKKSYWINRSESLPELFNISTNKVDNALKTSGSNIFILAEEETNQVEQKIAELFNEVLGIESFSKYDNFFELGGNSILAIQLLVKLNNYYQSSLNVADIFLYHSVSKLCERVFQVKNDYETIVKLNATNGAKNLFMIHPGAGGCEVYVDLAHKLSRYFSCYGVDSYNLYNENKILVLRELAEYYLLHIDKIMQDTKQNEYHILGWSFGGHIALEIASILEKRGVTKIKIYLLDTMILSDEYSISLINSIDIDQLVLEYEDRAILDGFDKSYIGKVAANLRVESQLVIQNISSALEHTDVLFFKAMLQDTRFAALGFREVSKHVMSLEYNNIDKFVKQSKIKRIVFPNVSHDMVLSQTDILVAELTGVKNNDVLPKKHKVDGGVLRASH